MDQIKADQISEKLLSENHSEEGGSQVHVQSDLGQPTGYISPDLPDENNQHKLIQIDPLVLDSQRNKTFILKTNPIGELSELEMSKLIIPKSQSDMNQSLNRPKSNAMSDVIKKSLAKRLETNASAKINLKQSFCDHLLILLYHIIEPLLVGCSLTVCLQLPMISGLVYIVATLCGIVPFLLTAERSKIKWKRFLSIFMILIALIALATKSYYYAESNHVLTPDSTLKLYHLFGIYPDQVFKTIIVDLAQFCICIVIFIHYQNMQQQAEARELIIQKQDYQTEVKLHHPVFGRRHQFIYLFAILMFLADALVLLTFVQLIILLGVCFGVFLANLSEAGFESTDSRLKQLRVMQLLLFLQCLAIYIIQLPGVLDNLTVNHPNTLAMFGILGLEDDSWPEDLVYVRVHLGIASFALIMTECYKMSVNVMKNAPQKTIMEDRPISDLLKLATSGSSVKVTQIKNSSYRTNSNLNQNTYQFSAGLQLKSKPAKKQRRETENVEELTKLQKLQKLWEVIRTSTYRWISRVLAFIWIYKYHDWQSVLIMIWLLHSTLYINSQLFRKSILYFYLPVYFLIFLWYYVTNVVGLIQWSELNQDQTIDRYNYGFFKFKFPPFESFFMFINVYFMILLTVAMEKEKESKDDVKFLMTHITTLKSSTWYQVMFLALVYVEFPLMLVLVVAGLDTMDLYHIVLLIFFVVYTLAGNKLNRFSLYLLIYADFFVLEKYAYTLVIKTQQNTSGGLDWMNILGLSSAYNPQSTAEYWRYAPKFDQWLLVVLAFILFRRSSIIGSDRDKVLVQERKTKAILAIKYPKSYRLFIGMDILWHYSIVLIVFTTLMTIIVLQQRTIINAVIQMIVMWLICVYYSNGLKSLLGVWPILIVATSFTLVIEICFQFLYQTAILPTFLENIGFWAAHPYLKNWLKWAGFYQLTGSNWLFFLPQILMFSISTLCQNRFRHKYELELKSIIVDEENEKIITEIDFETQQNESRDSLDQQLQQRNDSSEDSKRIIINQSFDIKNQLSQSVRIPTNSQARMSISKKQEQQISKMQEYKHLKQYIEMRYKLSYLMFRFKKAWPVFEYLASFFHLILSTFLLAFALYNSLALIWGLYLVIFVLQSIFTAKVHYQYRKDQEKHFEEQVGNNILDQRFVIREQENKRLQKLRKISESAHSDSGLSQNVHAVEDENETKIKLTDEQAIVEYKSFYSNIDKVTVTMRHYFWVTQFIFVMIAITMIYFFSFAVFWSTNSNPPIDPPVDPPISKEVATKIIFLAFFAGCYTDISIHQYFQDVFPFYCVLVLLIMEKLAQSWLIDKFGCDENICKQFTRMEEIHKGYTLSKTQLRKKIQVESIIESPSVVAMDMNMNQEVKARNSLLSPIEEEKERDSEGTSFVRNKPSLINSQVHNSLASMAFEEPAELLIQNQKDRNFTLNVRPSHSSLNQEISILMTQEQFQDKKDSVYSLGLAAKKEDLLEKIKEKFLIGSKLKILNAFKTLLEDVVILMVWCSCIYKQNILSIFLFVVLTFFTFTRSGFSVLVVRYTVLGVFILQYFMALSCLSSYNSPKQLPTQILVNNTYPTSEHFYFAIPVMMSWNATRNETGDIIAADINLNVTSYAGFPPDASRLNGIWIDYVVILLVLVYFNFCNFWLLYKSAVIVRSETTNNEIQEYVQLCNMETQNEDGEFKKPKMTFKKCLKYLDQQFAGVRATTSLQNFLFTYYHLFMIAFLLIISIFNESLLSFGYFMFCMVLIQDQKNLLTEHGARERMRKILKYFLLPYLLLDIFLNLIYQIPVSWLRQDSRKWSLIIGFNIIWNIFLDDSQQPLQLGYSGQITETNEGMTAYMMKGVTFFFISTMLQILSSQEFKEFQNQSISKLASNKQKIGAGLAYRFNNFKCKLIIQQAEDFAQISKMLNHVKKLIKKRDKLYAVKGSKEQKGGSLTNKSQRKLLSYASVIPEMYEENDNDRSQDNTHFDAQKFEKEEITEIKQIYEKNIKKLPCCFKFYLHLRRNFISDILFRYSEEHLDDIVDQLKQGRTSIKSKLEIGVMNKTKKEYLTLKTEEREEEKEREVVIDVKDQIANEVLVDKNIEDNQLKIEEDFPDYLEQNRLDEIQRAYEEQKKRLTFISEKPWERVDLTTNLTYKRMVTRYAVAAYKMIVCHTEFICYFWMVLACLLNGGVLYLVFPTIVFGYALLLEERPGKWFWYFVLLYTQFLIITEFALQLSLWGEVLPKKSMAKAKIFFERWNLGFRFETDQNWGNSFKKIIPEIMIICVVMIHILNQTMAGVFGFPFRRFESFDKGLLRYRLNLLHDESERQQLLFQMGTTAIQISLQKDEIDRYRDRSQRRYSQYDMYEYSKKQGDPIYTSKDLRYKPPKQLLPQDDSFVVLETQKQSKLKKSLSVDAIREADRPAPDENIFRRAGGFIKNVSRILWDNRFFEGIFPLIKQQKPGKDFYVWICTVQFIICLYILVFYTNMTNQQNSIASQYSSNQFSSGMVICLFSMIAIMVVDRVIYSTHTFMSFEDKVNEPHKNSNQERNPSEHPSPMPHLPEESFISDNSVKFNINDSLYMSERTSSDQQLKTKGFFENQMELQSEDSETIEAKNREFKDALVPQKQQKRASRVIRIYFLWFLLVLVHWFIFFRLPRTVYYCLSNPQVSPKTGNPITYPDPAYVCNTFTGNGYLITFYLLWMVYFYVAALQVQKGLPELRKGSFMIDDYSLTSCYIFRAYLAIPFIFELRTIIDWTFTSTALDVFQWIKLATIQASFYVAKCVNAGYMEKKLGEKIGLLWKILIGFSLMIFVLTLIAGPILLFSQINPISEINQMTTGFLGFAVTLTNSTTSSRNQVYMFVTTQLTQNLMISDEDYNELKFQDYTSSTAQFQPSQTQIIQFSPISDGVWTISPPNKSLLLDTLNKVLNGTASDATVTAEFNFGFQRANGALDTSSSFQVQLNNTSDQTQAVLQGLINQISCNRDGISDGDPIVNQFNSLIDITLKADQTNTLTQLNTQNSLYTKSGFNLLYYCDDLTPYSNYWALNQTFTNSTDQEQYNFLTQNVFFGDGFGMFVFSQKVLPSYLSAYSASILVFYITVVYVIATLFRSAFVPRIWEIPVWDAPFGEDILQICQSIHIYRVQMQLEKEEELYMILIDIMRSPEMTKSICGSSLKKKLQ